jgi:arabinose-5-phosphate isomerase
MKSETKNGRAARLRLARGVLRQEAYALRQVAKRLDGSFVRLVDRLRSIAGCVVVSGIGKSADVGRKMVATLNSTGSKAWFLDPAAAVHGDLGGIAANDFVLFLSHSGESLELLRVVDSLAWVGVPTGALTSRSDSTLARRVQFVFAYGSIREADPLDLAPSSSTTVMMALGDAIAFVLAGERGFSAADFARNHPAGNLGLQLTPVQKIMRQGDAMRLAPVDATIREVLLAASRPGRRTGAILLIDREGRLRGLFTDSDLARLVERVNDVATFPIREAMTVDPITITQNATLAEAVSRMSEHKISELPVVDEQRRPVGIIDITDILAVQPHCLSPRRNAA